MVGHHSVKGAAGAFGGVPKFVAGARIDAGETNGPGLGGGAPGAEEDGCSIRSDSNVGYLFSVRRPNRVGIAIDAGVEVDQGLRGDVVNGDERMVGAGGNEREAGAIGR